MQTYGFAFLKYFFAALVGATICYFMVASRSTPKTALPAPVVSENAPQEELGDSPFNVACTSKYQKLVDAKFIQYAGDLQRMALPPFSDFYPIEKLGTAGAQGFLSVESCKSFGDGIIQDGGKSCGFKCAMHGESESILMELWVPDNNDQEDKAVEVLELSFNHGA